MDSFHPFRVVADFRPNLSCTVYSAPVRIAGRTELQEHRFVVRWDEDEDPRVLAVISAFYFAAPREFRFVHCYGERKARLSVHQFGFADDVQKALRSVLDSDSVGAALGNDWFDLDIETHYLPPSDDSPLVEAAHALLRAKPSREIAAALALIAHPESVAAQQVGILQCGGVTTYDSTLASMHRLFRLGSFGLPHRPWPLAESQ